MNIKQLREVLDEHNIKYTMRTNKQDLLELVSSIGVQDDDPFGQNEPLGKEPVQMDLDIMKVPVNAPIRNPMKRKYSVKTNYFEENYADLNDCNTDSSKVKDGLMQQRKAAMVQLARKIIAEEG